MDADLVGAAIGRQHRQSLQAEPKFGATPPQAELKLGATPPQAELKVSATQLPTLARHCHECGADLEVGP